MAVLKVVAVNMHGSSALAATQPNGVGAVIGEPHHYCKASIDAPGTVNKGSHIERNYTIQSVRTVGP
jgi:hypothetical protein